MPFGRQVYEPPPPEWDSGPFPKGEPRIVYFKDRETREAWCRSWGVVGAGRRRPGEVIDGCYVPQFNMIGVPDPAHWPGGQREIDQLLRHEYGHARGGAHGTTKHEWVPADWFVEWQAKNAPSRAAQPTPADLSRVLSPGSERN